MSLRYLQQRLARNVTKQFVQHQIRHASGIAGIEVYIPNQYIPQVELEQYDQVSAGKYTKGLGQTNMAFVDTDREDSVSMIMSAVHGLLEKYQIDPAQVGRLEIGSETPIDKSKSIKSNLMSIFGDNTDLEGIDNVHACYGGTAALLNSLYWLESNKVHSKGNDKQRYAIVVCGDVSTYKEKNARPSGGAGAVALLLSANDDAPLQVDLSKKASHFEHAYDFYKPNPIDSHPIVDGHFSNICYLRSVDKCYERFLSKFDGKKDLSSFDFALFHAPYNKLVQKSLHRIVYNDSRLQGQLPAYLNVTDPELIEKANAALKLTPDESYSSKDLEKLFATVSADVYKAKTEPSTLLPKELGNSYTASLYMGLASLVWNQGKKLDNKSLILFSYGSGLAATLFQINAKDVDGKFSLADIQRNLDVQNRLAQRTKFTPQEYEQILAQNTARYLKSDYQSEANIQNLPTGAYYLQSVDNLWRRVYQRK